MLEFSIKSVYYFYNYKKEERYFSFGEKKRSPQKRKSVGNTWLQFTSYDTLFKMQEN